MCRSGYVKVTLSNSTDAGPLPAGIRASLPFEGLGRARMIRFAAAVALAMLWSSQKVDMISNLV
jgi:hypothetical protein